MQPTQILLPTEKLYQNIPRNLQVFKLLEVSPSTSFSIALREDVTNKFPKWTRKLLQITMNILVLLSCLYR